MLEPHTPASWSGDWWVGGGHTKRESNKLEEWGSQCRGGVQAAKRNSSVYYSVGKIRSEMSFSSELSDSTARKGLMSLDEFRWAFFIIFTQYFKKYLEDFLKKRSIKKFWGYCRQSQIFPRILMRWSFTWRLLLTNSVILIKPGITSPVIARKNTGEMD